MFQCEQPLASALKIAMQALPFLVNQAAVYRLWQHVLRLHARINIAQAVVHQVAVRGNALFNLA